jgi:telomerase reverse transcriptase
MHCYRRLACTAFNEVFHRRQTQYTTLLAWLKVQMNTAISKSSRAEKAMLLEAVARSTGSIQQLEQSDGSACNMMYDV